jgi:predicted glycogen debranching enzyme
VISGLRVGGMEFGALLGREWLAVNGIGGYACSTVPSLNTRKYHGLLVAAMAPPVRRMVLLSRVEETLFRDGQRFALDCNEYPGVIYPQGHRFLQEFQPGPNPRWIYEGDGWQLQKELRLLLGENTVVLTWTLLSRGAVDLQIRPLLAMRPIHDLSYQWNGRLLTEDRNKHHHHVPPTVRTPEVFFAHDGRFTASPNWYLNQIYRREQERGYSGLEDLWTPGTVRFHLTRGKAVHFVCSADPIEIRGIIKAPQQPQTHVSVDRALDGLRQAAGQFVVSRPGETAAAGRTAACMAGFPWFGPASRAGLIGFTGLLLVPGKYDEAKSLLTSLAARVRNGLMPSHFPEDGGEPLYQGADISLWFANAAWEYLRYTADDQTASHLLDVLLQIIESYRRGTDLGIRIDSNGLIASRAPGIPTSWMDAKVEDWVITPRIGRPVELNALWYNAVKIAADLCERYGRVDRAKALNELAATIKESFNQRFWNKQAGCCYDVVHDHGQDPSVRPNQILAISLPFPVLDDDRCETVLQKIQSDLLTPFGLRTLCPADPCYQGHYTGGIVSRDRAYHNGSAFPWLLAEYAAAFLRVRGRNESTRAQVERLIRPCLDHVLGAGLGQLCELFDADAPNAPGGALASAASVGQILRAYAEDVLGLTPTVPIPGAPVPTVEVLPQAAARISNPA